MKITGEMIIGSRMIRGGAAQLHAFDPAHGVDLEPTFGAADVELVNLACKLAGDAFDIYRTTSLEVRAQFLERIAENILALGDALIDRAHAESALPRARLEGERARTVGQLRLFASVVRDGRWLDATLDRALPDRKALGYPGRGTLVAWLDELQPERKKRALGKTSGIRYAPGLRQTAVIDLCTRRESAEEVAKKIGVSRPTLYNWRNRLLGQEAVSTMTRRNDPAQTSEQATLEQQVESLRRDIRKLQIEHNILKKANGILKKRPGVDPQLLTNREKTELVDALKQTYTQPELLAELGLARTPTSISGRGYRLPTSMLVYALSLQISLN